jgi:molybdopterin synthase catalytic subunit
LKSGIVRVRIDPAKVLESVEDDSSGGTVLFIGTVRNKSNGKEVTGLEYETYRKMAESKLAQLNREVRRRWKVNHVTMLHREGRLKVGDVSVAVAVSSPHRAEAFEAARFAIDRIKTSVPIWKREAFSDGKRRWVEGSVIQE